MDATLFVGTVSLSIYLPKCVLGYQTRSEQLSIATTIGLSLGLFSLSLLEAVPSSWLILLSHEETVRSGMNLPAGMLRISTAYWLLFWALSIMILVVAPSLAGASLADSFRGLCFNKNYGAVNDPDSRKYSTWKAMWRSSPWWIRFFCGLIYILTKNMWYLARKLCLLRRKSPAPPDLGVSRTLSDDDLRLPDGGDIELQGLVASSPRGTTTATNAGDHLCTFVGGLAGVFSVIILVRSIGPLVVHRTTEMSLLSVIVSWLCAVGLLISSLLNGFGSVSMPYSCLVGLYLTPVRNEVITRLESELLSVREATANKRLTLRELTVAIKQGSNHGPSKNKSKQTPSFVSKVYSNMTFSGIGEDMGNRRRFLQSEIKFLETLCQDMKADIEELRYSQLLASAARTTMGKVRSYIGLIFSVILLVRLGSAAMSIWRGGYKTDMMRHKVANGDIVTTGLLWLSGHDFVSEKDFTMLSQVISLVVTALLTFSQVRFFFRTVAAVHRRLSRFYQSCSCGTITAAAAVPVSSSTDERQGLGILTSGLFSQVLAGATGCYFLSCIVLIKMMLPEDFCVDFASAMGGMDIFSIQTSVVNTVFACSAGVSVAILGMLFGIQRQNTLRHTSTGNINIEGKLLRGAEAV